MANAPKQKFSLPKPPEPREAALIEKEYSSEMTDLATSSYLHFVYGENIKHHNSKLVSLNQELKARQELNKKASQDGTEQQKA